MVKYIGMALVMQSALIYWSSKKKNVCKVNCFCRVL